MLRAAYLVILVEVYDLFLVALSVVVVRRVTALGELVKIVNVLSLR